MVTNTRIALGLAFLLPTFAVGCMAVDGGDELRTLSADDGRECSNDGHEGADEGGADEGGSDDGVRPNCDGDEGDGDGDGDEVPGGDGDGGVCEPHETELIAGQHFDTGSVSVSNDDDEITIAVDTAAPYLLSEVHIYVGTDPVPTNNGGAPAPGQFPYKVEFPEPVSSYELTVALAELGVGCDESLNVAVHASVVSFDRSGNEVFSETAWGFGDEEFEGSRWGWSFDYGICCEEPGDESEGCTLTQGYWRTHNSEASVPALQEAWPIAEDTQMCGMGWLDILHTEPNGDAWLILAHQYIAAQLNLASGASTTDEVDSAMNSAAAYLDACAISDADRDAALAASELLDAYNNGDVGPGHCE